MTFNFIESIPDWEAFAVSCYNLALCYFFFDVGKFILNQLSSLRSKMRKFGKV